MIELASDVHDRLSGVLHIPKGAGESFRVSLDGSGPSEDAKIYTAFRMAYWKYRADSFIKTRPEVQISFDRESMRPPQK